MQVQQKQRNEELVPARGERERERESERESLGETRRSMLLLESIKRIIKT